MRMLKLILMAPVKIVMLFIQLVLTVCVVILGAAGGIVAKAGELVGGILILGSLLCVATGQVSGEIFLKMFFGGVAFGAIPAAITKLGEEGILVAKDTLYKLI